MPAITPAQAFMDANGRAYPIPLPATYRNYQVLAASVAESPAVPTGATRCVVTSPVDAYANGDAVAVVPSGDVTDGSGPIFIPAGYPKALNVGGLTSFSLISASATLVALEFYS